MGKHKHFKFMGFLNISSEVEIHKIPKIWERCIYLVREKYGKTEISHILRNLAYLELTRTHAIPNVWEYANSHKTEIFWGKPYHSQTVGFF